MIGSGAWRTAQFLTTIPIKVPIHSINR